MCVTVGPLRSRSQDGIGHARDGLGEMPLCVKGEGAPESRKESSDHNASLTPGKKGALPRQILKLQCSSKKGSARLMRSP